MEWIELGRDCSVIEIPAGTKTLLSEGTKVAVEQSLGGSFTLRTEMGALVRLEGKDANAIGFTVDYDALKQDDTRPLVERVWDELKTCFDPEIPVNIVELGLIYDCDVQPTVNGKNHVLVVMTLTAPGCGMGDVLKSDVERKVSGLHDVESVQVDVVFDPPWDQSKMSEAARLQLGFM